MDFLKKLEPFLAFKMSLFFQQTLCIFLRTHVAVSSASG